MRDGDAQARAGTTRPCLSRTRSRGDCGHSLRAAFLSMAPQPARSTWLNCRTCSIILTLGGPSSSAVQLMLFGGSLECLALTLNTVDDLVVALDRQLSCHLEDAACAAGPHAALVKHH